jgi:hypothetical protein
MEEHREGSSDLPERRPDYDGWQRLDASWGKLGESDGLDADFEFEVPGGRGRARWGRNATTGASILGVAAVAGLVVADKEHAYLTIPGCLLLVLGAIVVLKRHEER